MRLRLKLLLPIAILSLFFPYQILASSLEIAQDSNFESQTLNFAPGQTIYVRATGDNDGKDKHILNLRDNEYNVISSYNLDKIGDNQFLTSLNAPQDEGYYSLEAQLESGSNVSTSVKTIKVGDPSSASVRVNIKNRVQGQSSTGNNAGATITQNPSPAASPQESPTPQPENLSNEISDSQDVSFESEQSKVSLIVQIQRFFQKLLTFIWPF